MDQSNYHYPSRDWGQGEDCEGHKKQNNIKRIYVLQKYFYSDLSLTQLAYKATKMHVVNLPFPSHCGFETCAFSQVKRTAPACVLALHKPTPIVGLQSQSFPRSLSPDLLRVSKVMHWCLLPAPSSTPLLTSWQALWECTCMCVHVSTGVPELRCLFVCCGSSLTFLRQFLTDELTH